MIIRKTAMEQQSTRTTYCYSYHRISTKKQSKGGGIKRQIEQSAAYCEEQGWIMDTSFKLTDIGTSAFHSKNLDDKAALGGFLKAVDQGLVKRPAVLLIESLDRLSRAGIMEALELFLRIINNGITICTYVDRMVYNKEDLQTNFSPLIISITLMSRSHEESLIKSRRIKTSWEHRREKIKNGEIAHKGIYPDWIEVSTGKPKVIESRAAIVREIFDLSINYNMSYASIIKAIKEKHGDKTKISPNWINRLFVKKRVLGIYEPNEVNENTQHYQSLNEEIKAYPAIIDEKTFYAARVSVKKRMKTRKGRPSKKEVNFFVSQLYCGCCGSAVSMSTSGYTHTYRCRRRDRYKEDCGQRFSLAVKYFQPVLLQAISLIDRDDMLESTVTQKKGKLMNEVSIKESQLSDKQNKIENLMGLVAAGSKNGIAMVVELEKEVEGIQQEISEMTQQVDLLSSPAMASSIGHINKFHRRFQIGKATMEDKQAFVGALGNLVEKIVLFTPEHEGQRTVACLHLRSGVVIKVDVARDYSAHIYNGKKRIGRYLTAG